MESWRKLASSLKISAQFFAWDFFKPGIGVAMPAVLLGGIGASQHPMGPLSRISLNSSFCCRLKPAGRPDRYPFQQSLDSVGFIASQPLGNFGSRGLESVG